MAQVVTVVEGCHDAGIGSDHIAGDTAYSFGLVPLVSFSVAPGPNEMSSVSVTVSHTNSVIKCGFASPDALWL